KIKNTTFKIVLFVLVAVMFSCKNENNTTTENTSDAKTTQQHPKLILTAQGVKDIRAQLGTIPIFDKSLEAVKKEVDAEIEAGIDVP
nr:heparinase [Mariniflexile sp. KMM 9835]